MSRLADNLKMGIEFEVVLDDDAYSYVEDRESGYHSGMFHRDGFKVERDSSIHSEDEFPNTCEIITQPFKSTLLKKRINDFVELLGGKDCFETGVKFNSSTGTHIHFSVPVDKISNIFTFKVMQRFRRSLFRKVSINFPTKAQSWKKYFYRHYADKVECWTERKYYWVRIHDDHATIEVRGFHLVGFNKVDDIIKMLHFARDSMLYALSESLKHEDFIRTRHIFTLVSDDVNISYAGFNMRSSNIVSASVRTHYATREVSISTNRIMTEDI